ncbi:MAG: lysine 2,3-aminomutase [Candidatus Cloacimonetes bacterium]|nr:lysine 2,3-aminomutase [Candidatus Cloacimonadota bacterium]
MYKAYFLHNYRDIEQVKNLTTEERFDIEVVGNVLPFKVNSYVIDELINWDKVPNDPVYTLTFPRREMLLPEHYDKIAQLLRNKASRELVIQTANEIRNQLNPHPAGQTDLNVPRLDRKKIYGIQHKYRETALFFPSEGQTCHAYCTFCFRWPQFVGWKDLRFASKEAAQLVAYLKKHEEISDLLFTGGDPMVMKAEDLEYYIDHLLTDELSHIKHIRIGTKVLSYWPYRFLSDPDSDDLLRTLEKVVKAGKHLALMVHFNHYRELETEAVEKATKRLHNIGAILRTQAPILRNINAETETWKKMWEKQVDMGMIPYYMFVVRDTGAQHYFGVPLVESWEIFRHAYNSVSGLCRTVRGPSMSCIPGKVQVLGVAEVKGEKVIVMRMLQGRNPDWVHRPFFAQYDEKAAWIDCLKPAFGEEKFFFEDQLKKIYKQKIEDDSSSSYE